MIFSLKRNYPWRDSRTAYGPHAAGLQPIQPVKKISISFSVILLMLFTFSVAQVKAQNISIEAKAVLLYRVFKQIEKQSDYLFWYKGKMENKNVPITISLSNMPVKSALDKIFANIPFTYEIVGKTIVVKEKSAVKESSREKQKKQTVTGTVTDEKDQPLAGVSITLKGTDIVVLSDNNGAFSIEVSDKEALLQFSYVGYETYEQGVNDRVRLLVKLKESTNVLQGIEVVSTGYQVLPKERATGSFSFVDNALLSQRVSPTILERLEGNVPGLIFHKNTAASGEGGVDINIRGHSTLFANDQPLIVVDNFPYDGPISNINPNDVENVTILKDAASASIWGVKAGNGVIVITTKKGGKEKPLHTEFNSNLTLAGRPDLFYKPAERIAASDRIDIETMLYQQGYYTSKLTSSSNPAVPLTVSILDKIGKDLLTENEGKSLLQGMRTHDVRDDLTTYFYRPTINEQYALSFRGGGKNNDYYISTGYDNNRGNQVGFTNDRLNLMSNVSIYPSKKLTISANVNLTYTKRKSNSVLSDLNTLMVTGLLPEYTDLVDNSTKQSLELIRNYNPTYLEGLLDKGFVNWGYRPYDELSYADNTQKQMHNRINVGLGYTIIPGLSGSLKYQYERGVTENTDFRSLETYYTRNLINRFYDPAGAKKYPVPDDGGILLENRSNLTSHRARAQLDYKNNWNDTHSLAALIGSELSQVVTDSRGNVLYGYDPANLNFTNVDYTVTYPTHPEGSQLIPNTISAGRYNDRFLSYFANASYSYRQRYTLSASGRIDKSNLFGVKTNQKAAPLYSLGLSWDISKENFYPIDFLPYSKLRVTYGYNGNIDKSVSAFNTFVSLNNSIYYGLPHASIQTPGNDRLKWEKVRTINLGYDFATRNNRLSGSLEFYFKKGIDLFGYSPLASSTGFTALYGNTANVSTKGYDITLNSINTDTRSFRWTTNVMISHARDIVTDYRMEAQSISYINGIRSSIVQPLVGKPLFAVYSYRWAGLSSLNGDPQGYLNGQVSSDWDSIISNTTIGNMVYNGPARPVHFGSVRNTFTYKGVSVAANLVYKLGYYFRRSSINYGALYAGSYSHSDYYQRWQKPGDELRTRVPSLQTLPTSTSRDSFYTNSAILVEKGDHIRLQDITVSYDLKCNSNGILKLIQLYGNINNVGIVWRANDQGIDPDVYADSFPYGRMYSLGAKLLF
jgi:TonB-linked SusC/RagA family outer membrane protein